jgi:hypothetical protein
MAGSRRSSPNYLEGTYVETTTEQWMIMEDNEDGTTTLKFRLKVGDRFEEATMLMEMPLLEALMRGDLESPPEWRDEINSKTHEIPDSPEFS